MTPALSCLRHQVLPIARTTTRATIAVPWDILMHRTPSLHFRLGSGAVATTDRRGLKAGILSAPQSCPAQTTGPAFMLVTPSRKVCPQGLATRLTCTMYLERVALDILVSPKLRMLKAAIFKDVTTCCRLARASSTVTGLVPLILGERGYWER